jgi:hypothetical protein
LHAPHGRINLPSATAGEACSAERSYLTDESINAARASRIVGQSRSRGERPERNVGPRRAGRRGRTGLLEPGETIAATAADRVTAGAAGE